MNNHGFILLSSKIILNKVAFRLPPYLILLLGLEVVLADSESTNLLTLSQPPIQKVSE